MKVSTIPNKRIDDALIELGYQRWSILNFLTTKATHWNFLNRKDAAERARRINKVLNYFYIRRKGL